MSDESSTTATPHKTWLDKISHLLTGEPQDVDDLVELLREAKTGRQPVQGCPRPAASGAGKTAIHLGTGLRHRLLGLSRI